jgi:hypothetical protein
MAADLSTQLNHSFFGVPLHLVALPFHEPIEDLESLRGAIDLDKLRGIYTLEEF